MNLPSDDTSKKRENEVEYLGCVEEKDTNKEQTKAMSVGDDDVEDLCKDEIKEQIEASSRRDRNFLPPPDAEKICKVANMLQKII